MGKANWGVRLIATVAIISITVPAAVDINESHLFNPDWPPHAVLHDAMSFLMSMGLGGGALWLLRRGEQRSAGDVALAAILAVWPWASLLLAALVPTASYGTSVEGLTIPEILGVPLYPNAILSVVLIAMGIWGWAWARGATSAR